MKYLIMILATYVTASQINFANAQNGSASSGTNQDGDKKAEQELLALVDNKTELFQKGDYKVLLDFAKTTLTNDYIESRHSGEVFTRDSILADLTKQASAVSPSATKLEMYKKEIEKVRMYGGEVAIVTSKVKRRSEAQAKAGNAPFEYNITEIFVKQNGQWKWAGLQSTRIPIDQDKATEEVLALEKKLIEAMKSNDTGTRVAFFGQHTADNFHAVSVGGTVRDKDAYLAFLKSSDSIETKVESIDVLEPRVKPLGDVAVYTFRSSRKTKQLNAKTETNEFIVSRVYHLRGGEWKLVLQHLTEIPVKKS